MASSNQTELAGFTLVDGKFHLFFYYMFCDSFVFFLPSFERHGLVVNGVQEKVMDDFLRKKHTSDCLFALLYQLIFLGWDFKEGVLGDLIPPAQHKREQEASRQLFPPDLILLSKLEEPLLLLADHLERVDEGAAPVQRVPCHQDKGGLCAPGNERSQINSDKQG